MNQLSIVPITVLLISVVCLPSAKAADFDVPQTPGAVTRPLIIPDRPKRDFRKIPYVDKLLIEVGPAIDLPFPHTLPREKVDSLSALAGIQLREGENKHNGVHSVHLPKNITFPEAEALCQKILADPDIKSCAPPYLIEPTSGSLPPNNVIGVIDAGVTSHPDLDASRVLTSAGYNFFSNPTYGGPRSAGGGDPGSWVTVAESNTIGGTFEGCPTISDWHGTSVTGIIGASANNGMIAGIDCVFRPSSRRDRPRW